MLTLLCPNSQMDLIIASRQMIFSIIILFIDYVNGGELFTHLYQREKFSEDEVKIYIGEIVVALEHLHRVSDDLLQIDAIELSNSTCEIYCPLKLKI